MKKLLALGASLLVSISSCFISLPVHAAGPNLISNPSAESQATAGPVDWFKDQWLTNTAQFSVPTNGHSGSRSMLINMTSRTSGDAKWYFKHVTVEPNTRYTFSDFYKASVGTELTAEIIDTSGNYSYKWLGTASASSAWKQFSAGLTTPANARSITVFHSLAAVGTLQTDTFSLTKDDATTPPPPTPTPGLANGMVSLTFDDAWRTIHDNGLPIMQKYNFKTTQYLLSGETSDPAYMTVPMIQNFKNNGHELASHTIDHPHLRDVSAAELDRQLRVSQLDLRSWTGAPVNNFATPYGEFNSTVLTGIKKYYRSHRSVQAGFNTKGSGFDIYNLKVQNIVNTTTAAEVNQWVNQAKANKSWLILVYHRIDPNVNVELYNTTPTMLDAHFAAVKNSGLPVVTVDQALNYMTAP